MPSFERGAYEPSDEVRVFDAADDDEQEEEGSRLPLLIVIGLLVFAAFAGVVWLAYTQGVQRGRQDAPRMIVAEQGPVKSAPSNPGGTQSPYTGLKIYQAPAPADENDDDTSTAPPTPAGSAATKNAAPAVSPSLAPVIRPQVPAETTQKVAATPTPAVTKPAVQPTPAPAKPAATKTVATNSAAVSSPPAASVSRIATKPPAQLPSASSQSSAAPTTEAAGTTTTAASQTVPAVAASPASKSTGGDFVLQIGSYKSEDEANAAWKSFQAKHPMVGGYEQDIKKVDLGDKGTWYRLRVGAFADKSAAGTFCAKLKADGGDCIPSRQ